MKRPRDPALLLADRTVTWREMNERTDLTARRLREMGVGPGDRVAMAAAPSLEAAEVIHGLRRVGGVVVALSPDEPDPQTLASTASAQLVDLEELAKRDPGPPLEPHQLRPSDPRAVVFTSGSSGEQRGIILTEANLDAAARAAERVLRLLPGDRWLACLPLNHIGGLSIFLRSALVGFAVIPQERFSLPGTIAGMRKMSASAVSLVPTMLVRMLDAGWDVTPSLRFVLVGGGTAPQTLINRALDKGIPIAPSYGMTEASSQIATMTPWMSRKVGTVGPPLPGVRVRIGEDPSSPFPEDEPGPIWVSGETVASRTITGPLTLRDGWYGTNDLGMLDADGYLKILGRLDEIIVTGGEKVSPQDVESVLSAHPRVSEAAVVGLPDPEWGQRVVAAVVPRRGADLDEKDLSDFMRARLLHHKVPKAFVIVHDLPRTGPGKVDYTELRRQLLRGSP
jgi:O-succinylbenzoic acid--CoA ligase